MLRYTLLFILLNYPAETRDTHLAINFLKDKPVVFKPDKSINKRLFLEDYQSSEAFFPGKKTPKLYERIRESSVMIFSNQQKNEYLMGYMYEGNTKNAFSVFEIGYFEDDAKVKKNQATVSRDTSFVTDVTS